MAIDRSSQNWPDKIEIQEEPQPKPVKTLICCVCGDSTRGRQWWNRDTGYGVCSRSVEWVRSRGESEEEIRKNYGIEGVHFNVKELVITVPAGTN